MSFRSTVTVRFADIDPAGVVYYPCFLHYCHTAMEDFFAGPVGFPYPRLIAEHRIGFPAVHLEVDFRKPLRYGDEVSIGVAIERVGNTSVTWRYDLQVIGHPGTVADVKVVTACLDFDQFHACAVPTWLRDSLARFSRENAQESSQSR